MQTTPGLSELRFRDFGFGGFRRFRGFRGLGFRALGFRRLRRFRV